MGKTKRGEPRKRPEPPKCKKCGAVWERPKPKCPFCQAELPRPDFKKMHKPPEKKEEKEGSSSSSSDSEDEGEKKEQPKEEKKEKPKFEKPKCPNCQKELPFHFEDMVTDMDSKDINMKKKMLKFEVINV